MKREGGWIFLQRVKEPVTSVNQYKKSCVVWGDVGLILRNRFEQIITKTKADFCIYNLHLSSTRDVVKSFINE